MKQLAFFSLKGSIFKRRLPTKYVFLFGGLGNQLFQFAYAHFVAKSTGYKVILLDATKRVRVSRKFELGSLLGECGHRVSGRSLSFLSIFLAKYVNFELRIQNNYGIHLLTKEASDDFPLFSIGQYQEIQFIEFIEEEILADLTRIVSENSRVNKLSLKEGSSVAVHIRRGDYDLDHHGHLSLGYYFKALNGLDFANLIVHTDDCLVAGIFREQFPDAVVYGPKDATAWEVLSDLGKADVVVSANSTLSWWGAWLCVKNGGQALLPTIWFKSEGEPPPLLIDGFTLQNALWEEV